MHLFKNNYQNNQIIDWQFSHKQLVKIQNRITIQIEKGNFRQARNLQRLILKSLSTRLIASQKIFEIHNNKKFYLYRNSRKEVFLKTLNINKYIQLDESLFNKLSLLNKDFLFYFKLMCVLWIFALLPVNETLGGSFFYNHRLYRDQNDILKALQSILNSKNFQFLLIIKPSGFFNIENQKYIVKKALIEKKFLFFLFKHGEFEKFPVNYFKYNPYQSKLKTISLLEIIKNFSFYNINLKLKDSIAKLNCLNNNILSSNLNPIIYYNDLIILPNTNINHLKNIYKLIFKILKTRGLIIQKDKIWIINLHQGFNFLGWAIKKSNTQITITINRNNIKSHQLEIKKFLKYSRFLPMDRVIIELNKKIIDWQQCYAYTPKLYRVWAEMNYYLFWRVWRWCKKRHKNKGSKWIYNRYWKIKESKKWVFHTNNQYLKSYFIKQQPIIHLPASINVCKMKNFVKVKNILFQKYFALKKPQ